MTSKVNLTTDHIPFLQTTKSNIIYLNLKKKLMLLN